MDTAHDPFAGHPPVPAACVTSMAFVLASGIVLASYLPASAPLGPVIGLLAASGVCLIVAVGMMFRLQAFAWDAFFQVAKWAALGYVVVAGMLEYVFIYDGTRGAMLVVLTLSLLVWAVDIPLLLAFSVARFQPTAGQPEASVGPQRATDLVVGQRADGDV